MNQMVEIPQTYKIANRPNNLEELYNIDTMLFISKDTTDTYYRLPNT